VNRSPRKALGFRDIGRGTLGLTVGIVVVAAGSVNAPVTAHAAPAATAGVPATQELVVIRRDRVARIWPSVRARRMETVAARRPLTGVRTVLPVLGRRTGRDGLSWVHVRLPGRPVGHKGWIPGSGTRRIFTAWRLSVDLSERRVTVYNGGRVSRRFRAIIGTRSTPTPQGHFFVEEAVALGSQNGGPFALATSGRSNVLQEFAGGPGQIALHGTNNLSGALGGALSHGCVRLSTRAISWLARRVGAGTPLTVQP